MRSRALALVLASLALLLVQETAEAAPGYLRQPDIHGDSVVFCAEEDLWLVNTAAGAPRRLTAHMGNEQFPRFSPDGQRIAFSGDYDGNVDVFVIPAAGGEPRRLTWHPAREEVIGWTPDGKNVIFRSLATEPHGNWELYIVAAAGGDPQLLPLGWAARLDIDPQSGRWAFSRDDIERRTWKRYRGGLTTDIWVGHPDRADFAKVTNFPGTSSFPMWYGGRIYLASDLGGTTNLWSMKPDGSDRRQLTTETAWDVRWPAMGPEGRIVFLLGGDLYVLDVADGSRRRLDIDLPSDRVLTRVRYPKPEEHVTWFALAPDGDRVALTTRGEIFSVPVEEGPTLPVTHGSGARESWGSYDPQGERLAFVTDESGEEAIVTADAWGRGSRKTVMPAGESGWHLPPRWSPDGKWIAYADQTQTLYVVAAEGGGTPVTVDHCDYAEISEYDWSPDGRWLAYTKWLPTDYRSIFIYDTREKRAVAVTGWTTDNYSPAWDPDGRYLYFLSDRTINPLLDARDLRDVLIRPGKPYLVLLRPDVKDPFAALNGLPDGEDKEKADGKKDQASSEKKDAKGKKDKDAAKEKEEPAPPVEIVFDGLADRVVEVPVEAGQYGALGATAERLFYLSRPIQAMTEQPDFFEEPKPVNTLMTFDLKEKEAKTFLDGVDGYDLSAKAGKLAVERERGEIYVLDAAAPPEEDALEKAELSLEGVVLELDPREEWRQIYFEGWRHMRDFFWDASMSGVDWKAVRDRYAALLPRLATRNDLRDLVGETIGELCNSHTYVFGGDQGKSVPHVSTGMLGADVVREGTAFRVTRIYRGDPADAEPSPLAAPGVGVKEGDYLLAVQHRPFREGESFYANFEGLGDKDVVLTVADRPGAKETRDVVVKALSGESGLRYADWVRRNREYVAAQTGGRIGYIHLPDMGTSGLVEFNTWFYPQLRREGLIVDARWNGGGFVSQMIVECLRRKVVSFGRARGGGVYTHPYRAVNGPFVVLTDQHAGSDGDIFPATIQLEGLAPVIGERSWGGVVGIRADKLMVDGGFLTQPEYAWWDPRRGWGLENHGVDPDIVVTNLPQELARGKDAQLDRAIEEVMRLHAAHPPLEPQFGPAPLKTREAFREEK